jgi:hypothetical protein
MKIRHTLFALALAAACGQSLAAPPVTSWQGSLPPLGENRIVGLWRVEATIAPCQGGPSKSFSALIAVHAGGTFTSTDNNPVPSNGPAQGVWKYLGHDHYAMRMQFFSFAPTGVNVGSADIHQDTTLEWRGNAYTSAVDAFVLDTSGNVLAELCGTTQGTRVSLN